MFFNTLSQHISCALSFSIGEHSLGWLSKVCWLYTVCCHILFLHCGEGYFTALHCIVLHCIALYCTILEYCTVLHKIVYCIVLDCIVLGCIVLYCIVWYGIVLYCIHCICIWCCVVAAAPQTSGTMLAHLFHRSKRVKMGPESRFGGPQAIFIPKSVSPKDNSWAWRLQFQNFHCSSQWRSHVPAKYDHDTATKSGPIAGCGEERLLASASTQFSPNFMGVKLPFKACDRMPFFQGFVFFALYNCSCCAPHDCKQNPLWVPKQFYDLTRNVVNVVIAGTCH